MFRLAANVLVMLCAGAFASQVQAQAVRTQIPIVTRLVQAYSEYEQQLAEAINRKDKGEIDRLVAPDFALWSANNMDVPVPRADWLAQSLKEKPVAMSIGQMAVHDWGNVRVVSFVMEPTKVSRRAPALAVVDVWMQSGDSSVLKTRYAAYQAPAFLRIPVPGEVRQKQIEKRY